MEELPFSNREIIEKFNNVEERSEEHHKDVMRELREIKVQTTEHNHRMSKIEQKQIQQKSMMTTGVAIFVVLVIPLIIYSFAQATKCADGSCQTVTNNTINK